MNIKKIYVDNLHRKLLGMNYLLPKDDSMYCSRHYTNNLKVDLNKTTQKYFIKKMPNFCYELEMIANTSHRMQNPA